MAQVIEEKSRRPGVDDPDVETLPPGGPVADTTPDTEAETASDAAGAAIPAEAAPEEPEAETAVSDAQAPASEVAEGEVVTAAAPVPPRAIDVGALSDLDREVHEMLVKAQALVTHAIETGADIKSEYIDNISAAARAFGTADFTVERQTKFMNTYRELSAALGGISTDSMEWTRNQGRRMTYWLAVFGGFMLVGLIWMQSIVIELRDSTASYEALISQLDETDAAFAKGDAELRSLTEEITSLEDSKGPAAAIVQQEESSLSELRRRKLELIGQNQELQNTTARLITRLDAQWEIISGLVSGIERDPPPEKPWFWEPDAAWQIYREDKQIYDTESQLGFDETAREYGFQQAKSTLSLYEGYMLPALYGLLGTVAFILRAFAREIRNLTLQASSLLNYAVRLPLGALSGIAVGLVVTDQSNVAGLGNITPLALAFVAGYSVELLFTAMDRIVMAFSGEQRR